MSPTITDDLRQFTRISGFGQPDRLAVARACAGAIERIEELERALGAQVLANWIEWRNAECPEIHPDSPIAMTFAAAGFDPSVDDIRHFQNAYMARFAPAGSKHAL